MDQWSSLPLMLTKNAWQKTKSIKHLDSLVRRLTGHWISCIKPKTYSNQFEYPAIYVCVCVNVTNSQVYLCFASHLNLNHQPLLPCFSIEINEKIVERSFFNSLKYVFFFNNFPHSYKKRCNAVSWFILTGRVPPSWYFCGFYFHSINCEHHLQCLRCFCVTQLKL